MLFVTPALSFYYVSYYLTLLKHFWGEAPAKLKYYSHGGTLTWQTTTMPKVKTIPCLITIYCNLLDCIATIVVHKVQQIALSSYGVKAMDQAPGYVNCGHISFC